MTKSRNRLPELMRALGALDIDFSLVREQIAEEFRARQSGLPPSPSGFFKLGNWDEGAFWVSFRQAMRRGDFDGFIYRHGPEQMGCFWADCRRHTLEGRFDHLIRAWSHG